MLSYQIIVICGHKIDNITAFMLQLLANCLRKLADVEGGS